MAVLLFYNIWTKEVQHFQIEWFTLWFANHKISLTAGVLLDNVTVLMLLIVSLVSLLVHFFSLAYMRDDPGCVRYFSFLGLFTFAMLGIVLADNLLLIFFFWELVGLSSYLLIGFWYKRDTAVNASQKAFLVNRIGDLGFLIAIMILWSRFGTLDLENLKLLTPTLPNGDLSWHASPVFVIFGNTFSFSINWLTVAGIGLFCGAVAKSAQFPLQIWLPDAMEGPTPVSALIHAATMVAAGVFLLIRTFGLLNMDALTVIAFIGAITAFMGAFAAFTQDDIKKVLAFSTISQLGYMIMGIGTGAFDAAIFHLITHAFFKACLFLCAGSIIHALHKFEHDFSDSRVGGFDAQNMLFMGGLRRHLPITYVAYIVAAASLIGLPFFSGFLSKDALLAGAWAWAEAKSDGLFSFAFLVPDLAFLTVLLTAAYMTRQFVLVFLGRFRGATIAGIAIKESSLKIKLPLIVLALLSMGIFFSINPFSNSSAWILNGFSNFGHISIHYIDSSVFELKQSINGKLEALHLTIAIASTVMALSGIVIGWSLNRFQKTIFPIPPSLFSPDSTIYKLSLHNFYLNSLYNAIFVLPTVKCAELLNRFDKNRIDEIVHFIAKFNVVFSHVIAWTDRVFVDGVVKLVVFSTGELGSVVKKMQGGKIQNYIIWALIGLIIIFTLIRLPS